MSADRHRPLMLVRIAEVALLAFLLYTAARWMRPRTR
jgi:hypothetical protein